MTGNDKPETQKQISHRVSMQKIEDAFDTYKECGSNMSEVQRKTKHSKTSLNRWSKEFKWDERLKNIKEAKIQAVGETELELAKTARNETRLMLVHVGESIRQNNEHFDIKDFVALAQIPLQTTEKNQSTEPPSTGIKATLELPIDIAQMLGDIIVQKRLLKPKEEIINITPEPLN